MNAEAPAPRPLAVAVVEDDPEDMATIRRRLSRLQSYRVEFFALPSFEAGRAALLERPFDIALVDFRLGPVDAFTLAEAVGGSEAMAPLVLLTGVADPATEERAAAAGFLDWLDKNENRAAVIERTLRYAMAAHRRERALAHALARLREAETARNGFVARLSHDLRGPLNGVIGFAEMLEAGRADGDAAKARNYAATIGACARQCLGLVEELISLEAPQSAPPPTQAVDAVAAVREGLAALAPEAEAFGVALRFEADPPEIMAHAHAAVLRRIVQNLVDNALRYAAAAVEVRLALEADTVLLTVRDDGPGVATDMIDVIRAPLARGAQIGRRGGRGSGLGLASVDTLVAAQGGVLTLRSEQGRGLTATVSLPAAAAP
ncbi:MAG: sensor histidine kinase [Rhodobacteraceae bacterium]|nr:MAG: sensor histidine kinase [Paracoccaceae bacterium]